MAFVERGKGDFWSNVRFDNHVGKSGRCQFIPQAGAGEWPAYSPTIATQPGAVQARAAQLYLANRIRVAGKFRGGIYHFLYGRNLPSRVTTTRSPLGDSTFLMSISKSIALMMPSPNISWIRAFIVDP